MAAHLRILFPLFLFLSLICANQLHAKEKLHAYFSNDSINGLKVSDAYETHNMGAVYTSDKYYLQLELGIVSPDMHVYINQYREANRSFGELISLEIGQSENATEGPRFYARVKATGAFGVDKIQDFAHRLLSLQQINRVNDLIRMPADAWFGIGLRGEYDQKLLDLPNVKLNLDGFVGSDTAFVSAKFTKEFYRPLLTYDLALGGRLVAYDQVVSAPPINAKERRIIPELSFGISYDTGPFTVFVRDAFSLPSIESDNDLFGVLSAGVSYDF